MKIQITQQDIDNGKVRDVSGCAIATALQQELAYEIKVAGLILIGKDYYQATPELVRGIKDFDKGEGVKPITIELVPYKFAKIYRPRGRQPIGIHGEAHVAHS